jgi:hypothetical protein
VVAGGRAEVGPHERGPLRIGERLQGLDHAVDIRGAQHATRATAAAD